MYKGNNVLWATLASFAEVFKDSLQRMSRYKLYLKAMEKLRYNLECQLSTSPILFLCLVCGVVVYWCTRCKSIENQIHGSQSPIKILKSLSSHSLSLFLLLGTWTYKFCMDIQNINLRRPNHSDLWIRLLFLLNVQKLLFDWWRHPVKFAECYKKIKPFISHTTDSRWTKLAVFYNTGLEKLWNRSEFLFSFLFSFHKMTSNGAVSHKIVRVRSDTAFPNFIV